MGNKIKVRFCGIFQKHYLLLLTFQIILSVVCYAQQNKNISGVVFSKTTGEVLESATIRNLKSGKLLRTDAKGNFSIMAKVKDTLVVSIINYLDNVVIVDGKRTAYNIYMEDAPNSLNEVVVVGYGTVKRKDLTGAVGEVNVKDMTKAPVKSFDEMLAGRVAGVQVTSSDGQPGSGVNIVIRGANSITQSNAPLYVIDGFPIEGADNNAINPDDIESMSVLKDASATAIYGARGSNGVIMITTKKGMNGNAVVSLNAQYGVNKVRKKMEMMSAYDFVKYQLAYNPSTTPWDPSSLTTSVTPYQLYLSGGTTMDYYRDSTSAYDWQSAAMRTAPWLDATINIRGGNNSTRYSASANIVDQDGIFLNSDYKRYQGRFSLDHTVSSKIKMGINANYSRMEQNGITVNSSTNSGTKNLMFSLWGYRTVTPSPASSAVTGVVSEVFGDDDNSASVDETVSSANDYRFNPIRNLKNAFNKVFTNNLMANAYVEYNIMPNLKLRSSGGINNRAINTQTFNNSSTQSGNPYTNSNGPNGSIYNRTINSWLNENTLTYTKTINAHHIDVLVGLTEQKGTSSNYGYSAIQVPNESLNINALSQGTISSTTATASEWTMASYIARANYNYLSKYLFTFTYRSDGSSRFADGNKWASFYSGSIAWNFYKESFMKNLALLSDGKLRLSYGGTGNNRVDDYATLAAYTMVPSATNVYTFDNSITTGASPTSIGNTKLKWETTYQLDLGMDLAFWNNKILLTVDYYDKKTKDLLLNASIPPSSGYTSVYKNIGQVSNKGLEFTLNTTNITTSKFSWTSTFNISFNKGTVDKLNEGQESLLSTLSWDNNWKNIPAYIAKIGQPIGMMYGYIWDGVYQNSDFDVNGSTYTLKSTVPTNGNTRSNIKPGDIKYKDLNGDGVVNAYDYTIIGNGAPTHIGGFGNNFTYGNFDLNVFLQWSYGNDIQNVNRMVFEGNAMGKTFLNQYASYSNYWTPENTNTDLYRANGFYGGGYSSRTVEDGSYLRLKTISLGCKMPRTALSRYKIKSVRFFASAQNLITWTKYTGVDPEVNAYNSALTPGFDYSPYPRSRTYVFGLNVEF